MEKQSKSEKKRIPWPFLALLLAWTIIFIVVDSYFPPSYAEKRIEMRLYVYAIYLSTTLLICTLAAYHFEGLKLREFPWLRIVPFIAWFICFYILLFWASTQETLMPLFYSVFIGLLLGAIFFGVSIWPVAKKWG